MSDKNESKSNAELVALVERQSQMITQQSQMMALLLDKLGEKMPTDTRSSHERMLEFLRPPGPPSLVVRDCTSPMTGWKFDAILDQNKRVLRFDNYHHPGVEKHIAQGGIVPDGMPIKGLDGLFTKDYRNWICRFYPQDNAFFIGKPFDATIAQTKSVPTVLESSVNPAYAA